MNQIQKKVLHVCISLFVVVSQLYFEIDSPQKVYAAETNISTSTGGIGFLRYPGNPIVVDSNITVSFDGEVTGANVTLNNAKTGDILTGTNGTWNDTKKTLSFSGTYTSSTLQDVFRSVQFDTESTNLESRSVNFTIGDAVTFQISGVNHFYKYISGSYTWEAALMDAETESRKYLGLNGYLATITSAEENAFIVQKLAADAWIGASDTEIEKTWKWMSGPEKGTAFFDQTNLTPINGKYTNWSNNEPNDYNNGTPGEDAAEIFYSVNDTEGKNGKWNDLPSNTSTTILGYVIEYGGMSTDPTLTLTANRTIDVQGFTATYNANGATNGSVPVDSNEYANLGIVTVLGNVNSLQKTDYSFVGWNTAANGSGTLYQDRDQISLASNLTLYAQWLKLNASSTTVNYVRGLTSQLIDPNFILDGTYLNYAYVSIRNYQPNDVLTYNNSVSGITGTYRMGRLQLFASTALPASSFQEAIRSVSFSTTDILGTRTIDYSVNNNGHFYQLFTHPSSLTWSDAKQVAETQTWNGKNGFLATITSESEDVIVSLLNSGTSITQAWMGAKDIANTSTPVTNTADWRWVTGYEGSLNSGTGVSFWTGTYYGTAITNKYARWATNEPNNSSVYGAYWYDKNGWDDLSGPITSYVVEYGSGPATFSTATSTINVQTLSVNYDANGGTGSMASTPSDAGSSTTLRSNAFTKSGYSFSGWATSADDSVVYSNGQTLTMPTSGLNLYAVWTANTQNITYNSNLGSGEMSNTTALTDASVTLKANTFTRNHYTFAGWATSANGSVVYEDAQTFTMPTSGLNLYAKWTPVVYAISYELKGGTSSNQSTYTIETPSFILSSASRNNYTFSHWELNGSKVTSIPIGSSGDKTLTAIYATTLISSSGNATYDQAQISIDSNIQVATDEAIPGLKVSIRNGISGDQLIITDALPVGVTSSFNTSTFVLTISGNMSVDTAQTLLRAVKFKTSNVSNTQRVIDFYLGSAVGLTLDGKTHYYEYFPGPLYWDQAYTSAKEKSLFGLKGYLATITSQTENDYIFSKLKADAWIGGSDQFDAINLAVGSTRYVDQVAAENHWTWMSGPESGTEFSLDDVVVSGMYENWASSEPNNSGGEHYAQLYSSNQGLWNDLPNNVNLGYVVEYGGYASDFNQLLATKMIEMGDRYAVTFKDYNNTILNSQIVFKNEDAIVPTSPSRLGYTFNQWSVASTNVTSTLNVIAEYTPNTNTAYSVQVYFETVGGDTYVRNDDLTLNLTGTTDSSVSASVHSYPGFTENTNHAQRLVSSTILPDGSLVLRVFYQRNHQTVNFYDGETLLSDQTLNYGATLTAPTNPTLRGYAFSGWFKNASTVVYDFATAITADFDLTAKWAIIHYDLNYVTEGGTPSTSLPTTYTVVDEFALPNLVKPGFIFEGWYDNAEFLGSALTQHVSNQVDEKTYYAKYRYGSFSLNYLDSDIDSISVVYQTLQPTPNTPKKEGYRFVGWTLDAQGTQDYEPGLMPASVVNVYAQWRIVNYGLTYDYDGGTGSNPQSYTILDAVNLGSASKTGHTFNGWLNESGQSISGLEKGSIGDRSFKAQWLFAPKAPVISSLNVSNIQANSADIEVALSDLGNPKVQSIAYTLTNQSNQETSQGSFNGSLSLDHLLPYTTYQLNINVRNGYFKDSFTLSFTTTPKDSDEDGIPDERDLYPEDPSKSYDPLTLLENQEPVITIRGSLVESDRPYYSVEIKAEELLNLNPSDSIEVQMGTIIFSIPVALVDVLLANSDQNSTTLSLRVEPQLLDENTKITMLSSEDHIVLSAFNYRLIQISSDGSEVELHDLTGSIKVGIGLAGLEGEYDPSTLEVYYYNDENGLIESMNATYDEASHAMVFMTDHFSYYVIGVKKSEDPTHVGLQLLGLLIALGIAIYSFFRYRKAK